MIAARPSAGSLRHVCRSCRAKRLQPADLQQHALRRHQHTTATASTTKTPSQRRLLLYSSAAVSASAAAGALLLSLPLREAQAESPTQPKSKTPPTAPWAPQRDLTLEEPKAVRGLSKEDTRSLISSQHQQVRKSWEKPGVYAWGSNTGGVVAPGSDEASVKSPRRIGFFDGRVLRDLKLDRTFAAAITDNGDLYQWGTGFSKENAQPTATLRGKKLVSLALTKDRVLALSKSGTVYSVPVSQEDQASGVKPKESSWVPFMGGESPISYRTIKPKLAGSERVTSISAGLEHLLLLTSEGRVFSSAASSTDFPSRGQLGIPGLSWATRPEGAYDQPHELATLRGFNASAIAAGDLHSVVLDNAGRVFAFGDNSAGQLGQEPSQEFSTVDAPSLLALSRLYQGTAQQPAVTAIAAGGLNSFFTVDATRVAQPGETTKNPLLGRVTSDVWAAGQGIMGQLGTGRWTHVQGTPAKIKPLSGLFEYDETANTVIPIRVARLSVGATHAAATLANVTYLDASAGSSANDTNWGADVLWWGGNEYYQLGTGRRNNCSQPVYIGPLDGTSNPSEKREEHRLHITPRKRVAIGGRMMDVEQRVECGRYVTAVYSGV